MTPRMWILKRSVPDTGFYFRGPEVLYLTQFAKEVSAFFLQIMM